MSIVIYNYLGLRNHVVELIPALSGFVPVYHECSQIEYHDSHIGPDDMIFQPLYLALWPLIYMGVTIILELAFALRDENLWQNSCCFNLEFLVTST